MSFQLIRSSFKLGATLSMLVYFTLPTTYSIETKPASLQQKEEKSFLPTNQKFTSPSSKFQKREVASKNQELEDAPLLPLNSAKSEEFQP
jgi:hypothetical protein